VNVADLPWHEFGHGENFAVRDKRLAQTASSTPSDPRRAPGVA
jgi:hypothetical protein